MSKWVGFWIVGMASLLWAGPAEAQRGSTVRVSVSSTGGQGNQDSGAYWYGNHGASVSFDGRHLAFASFANNLVPNDTNGAADVFVRDLQTGLTIRVSVSSNGSQGSGDSWSPSISQDGRYVTFTSRAEDLVSNEGTYSEEDVFVHDRLTGQTTRASVSSEGNEADRDSGESSISADGRFVAFRSFASNLVVGTGYVSHVYVHDRNTGVTRLASVSSIGTPGNSASVMPVISGNGRSVAFASWSSNLVQGDTNNRRDVFVHDSQTGHTIRASVSSFGAQGNEASGFFHQDFELRDLSISTDGRIVVFSSEAGNLVQGDTNNWQDVFVHDRLTSQTSRVSVSATGQQSNGNSYSTSLSSDGRYIVFESGANNLVPLDTNDTAEVFVYDRHTGQIGRIAVASDNQEGNDWSWFPSISSDGRHVAFSSFAQNLVQGDTNNRADVFVHQFGSGEGWGTGGGGPGNQDGNTIGDTNLRNRNKERQTSKPIILVNGLSLADTWNQFIGSTTGHAQWDNFKANLAFEYSHLGYSVYDPNTNPNGNIFVCQGLNTYFGVTFNAVLLNLYIQGIQNAPAFQSSQEFDIVGYSMGGLIARKWEQMYDKSFGPNRERYHVLGKKLGNMVTLATPHQGSPIADGLVRLGVGGLIPSVNDLTTPSTFVFNLLNPGLPGTRYAQIGAATGTWPPLSLSDGVVPNYSSRSKWWVRDGFQGDNRLITPFAHMSIGNAIGILDDMPSVNATYQAIFGGGLDSLHEDVSDLFEALSRRATVALGGQHAETVPIPEAATEAHFSLKWSTGTVQQSLIEPGGRVIDEQVASSDPNVDFSSFGGFASGFVVRNPRAGVWTIKAVAESDVPLEGAPCDFIAADDAETFAHAQAPRMVRAGAQGRFLVSMSAKPKRLTGSATATLIKPDGSSTLLALHDDGLHGDGPAKDGLFGSDLIAGSPSGAYAAYGHVRGTWIGFGSAQRTFSARFDASPETGRFLSLTAVEAVDDPADEDAYFDMLNVDFSLDFQAAGIYTLAADLQASDGRLIASASEPFEVTETGTRLQTLSFIGAVIGESQGAGPFRIANVALSDDTEASLLTDFIPLAGMTPAYGILDFETIHARAVSPAGWLKQGMNLISLPLEPLPGNTVRSILGAAVIPGGISETSLVRGRAVWAKYLTAPTLVSYLGTQDDNEFDLVLTQGKNLVGCPYNRPLPLSRCVVQNMSTGLVRTAEQDAANAQPWLNWAWTYYVAGQARSLQLTGGNDDHLRPWRGYEVQVLVPEVRLTLRD